MLVILGVSKKGSSAQARGVPADIFLKFANDEVGEIGTTLGGSGGDIAKSLPVHDAADHNRTQIALQMIDAGIDVRSEPAAFKWCAGYLQDKVKSLRDKQHYKCPESWRAFIIPDFSQQLGPQEAIFWVSAASDTWRARHWWPETLARRHGTCRS